MLQKLEVTKGTWPGFTTSEVWATLSHLKSSKAAGPFKTPPSHTTAFQQILGDDILPTGQAGRWHPAGPKERQGSRKAGQLPPNLPNPNNLEGDGTPSDKPSPLWSWNTSSLRIRQAIGVNKAQKTSCFSSPSQSATASNAAQWRGAFWHSSIIQDHTTVFGGMS